MQTLHSLMNTNGRVLNRHLGKVYGYLPAIVTRLHDPKVADRYKQGYVEVYFPTLQLDAKMPCLGEGDLKNLYQKPSVYTTWARLVTPAAGAVAGVYHMPQIGDEVLCAFEQGDVHHPYVIGCLWNGKANVPKPNPGCCGDDFSSNVLAGDGGKNEVMFWRSRTGNCISLSDVSGKESITITDRSGNSCIVMKKDKILIKQVSKDIRAHAKNLVRFDCKDFKVTAKKSISKKTSSHVVDAGANYSTSAKKEISHISKGKITIKAMKNITWSASDKLEIQSKGGSITWTAMQEIVIAASKKKVAIDAKGPMTFTAIAKLLVASSKAMLIKAGGMMTIAAGVNLVFKGSQAKFNCGGGGGFSLFGAILNAIKGAAKALVKGAIAAAKAVAGAVVAGAKAIGRGIAAVAGGVVKLATAAGKAVARAAKTVVKAVGKAAKAVGNAVVKVAKTVARAAVTGAKAVASVAKKAVKAVAHAAQTVANTAKKAVQAVGQAVRAAAEKAVQGVKAAGEMVKKVAKKAAQAVEGAAKAAIKTAEKAVKQVEKVVKKAVKETKSLGEKMADGVRDAVDGAQKVFNDAKRSVENAAKETVKGIKEIGSKVADGVGRLKDVAVAVAGGAADTMHDGLKKGAKAIGGAIEKGGKALGDGITNGSKTLADGLRGGGKGKDKPKPGQNQPGPGQNQPAPGQKDEEKKEEDDKPASEKRKRIIQIAEQERAKGIRDGNAHIDDYWAKLLDKSSAAAYRQAMGSSSIVNTNRGSWCNAFAGYCWKSAGVYCGWDAPGPGAQRLYNWMKSHGKARPSSFTPQVGDMVFWGAAGNLDHVGLVKTVSGKSFTTIEGNYGDAIGSRTCTVGSGIFGFGSVD